MQTAIITVEKNLQTVWKQNTRIQKKQLQTSASRGSYIKNVKKKNLTNPTEALHW